MQAKESTLALKPRQTSPSKTGGGDSDSVASQKVFEFF